MAVSSRHLLSQQSYLRALAHGTWISVRQRVRAPGAPPELPGSEVRELADGPPVALLEAYLRHLDIESRAYAGTVPPHLFTQWCSSAVARALAGVPHRLHRVLLSGCRLELTAPLPAGSPLSVTARLASIRRAGCCDILEVRVHTGPPARPDALRVDVALSVPAQGPVETSDATPLPAVLPRDALELERWQLAHDDGVAFAKLTGDLNPLHWAAPYARALGFGGVVAHGLALLARAQEAVRRRWLDGDARAPHTIDARFPHALCLPAVATAHAHGADVFVTSERGAVANLVARVEVPGRDLAALQTAR